MKILFVEPYDRTLFSFRKELLDKLIELKYDVILCTTATERVVNEYSGKVDKIYDIKMNLKNRNPFSNLKLKHEYKKIIKKEKPNWILSFSVKPNLYCGTYAKNTHMIANVTGLGNMFRTDNLLSKIGVFLYKKSFKNIEWVFFQNRDGHDFFLKNKIPVKKYEIIPGSGVNTNRFINDTPLKDDGFVRFLYASRAIKEKGFFLLIDAIPFVLKKCPNAIFNFLNAEENIFLNTKFKDLLQKFPNNVFAIQRTENMPDVYKRNDFIVLPSFYREGISNVLLESLSCERPIITTNDNPGCMEVLQEGINGFGIKSNDIKSLTEALVSASKKSKKQIGKMGACGRTFVVNNFDRKIVIDSYLTVINKIDCEYAL